MLVHTSLILPIGICKATKKSFLNENNIGMEPSKTNPTRWNDTTTIPHHPYIFVPFCQLWFVFVSCVHRRQWEGSAHSHCVVDSL